MSRGIVVCSQCKGLIHGPHLVESYGTRRKHFCDALHAYRYAYDHIPKLSAKDMPHLSSSMDAYREGYASSYVSHLAKTA